MTPTDLAKRLLERIIRVDGPMPAVVRVVGTAEERQLALVTWQHRLPDGRVLVADALIDDMPVGEIGAIRGMAASADCNLTVHLVPVDRVHHVLTFGREVRWRHVWAREFQVRRGDLVEIEPHRSLTRSLDRAGRVPRRHAEVDWWPEIPF